ncbi:MAG TPA: acyl-CoA dehydrogenase family protein [Nevskiales bacterium]|nr:acyl-CoA dehydrogenase family protein [Nevskiales bacterium]
MTTASAHKRDIMGFGLALLNRFAGWPLIDRLGLRKASERVVYQATKAGFRTAGALSRAFKATQKLAGPARLAKGAPRELFDLTPTDEQQMMRESVQRFAAEQLRPAAAKANEACAAPPELLAGSLDLGLHLLGVPEALGGAGSERSVMTNVLVAEAMAQGDMGLAVACLAPLAVSQALVEWGNAEQQSTYLPAFTGETVPAAALALLEPRPLFDPLLLDTKARAAGDGYVLSGVKSLAPRAHEAELFVIAAELEGKGPALFLVESSSAGLSVEAEPSMGLRAASLGRVILEDVKLPRRALLGEASAETYAECLRLSRLAWCSLAVGTAQAVLDYVIPYVNERVAFGEPISHRQSVAFMVANIAIELEGMRLATWRAASRAEQGKPYAREVALARRLCAERGMQIGNDGVQLLGGHGFVKEHPVERWYRDLRAVGVMEGGLLV